MLAFVTLNSGGCARYICPFSMSWLKGWFLKKLNKRVIAVGTTVTRVLEYCFTKKIQNDYEGEVDLYITPGYNFKAINCLITNYHLPKSTLLLLVSSFIDFNYLMTLYKSAIENDYKFYSYGDSMFIDKMLWNSL